MEIIDITVALHEDVPSWPGSCGFKRLQVMHLTEGDLCNGSEVRFDCHCATHVDAPWHFLKNGTTVEHLDLTKCVGPAYVANVSPGESAVTAAVLEGLSIPKSTKRLLLRTSNSQLWARSVREFQKDFVAVTADGARWLVDRRIELIGIDYLSIAPFDNSKMTHEVLLAAEIVVIEGLDLSMVEQGEYELICLPMKIAGSDGAPARVILRR